MLLSEHIAECAKLISEHGDLPVFHTPGAACGCGMNFDDERTPSVEFQRSYEVCSFGARTGEVVPDRFLIDWSC